MKVQKTMHEILSEYSELEQQLIENEGELTEELNERININRNEAEQKIEAYYYVRESLLNKAELEKAQKERFEKRETTLRNSANRLKDAVDQAMSLYGVMDIKSKAKIPSLKLEAGSVKATAVAYPVIDPSTIPPTESLLKEIDKKYIDCRITIKTDVDDAILLQDAVAMYNEKVGSKIGKLAIVPEFIPSLNTDKVKDDLKNNISVGEMKLNNNYKTKFS